MKPITVWYARTDKDKGYFHNHIEDGHINLKHLVPKHDSQDVWMLWDWLKKHTYLKDGRVLE